MKDRIKKAIDKLSPTKKEKKEQDVEEIVKENKILNKKLSDSAHDKFITRRSIHRFEDRPIDWNVLYKIIEGGLNAPCAGNIQNYNIVVVEDKDKKKLLSTAAMEQYWLANASAILIILRNDSPVFEMFPEHGKRYSIQNVAALIENIIMLSHFNGLGSCWVDACNSDVIREKFKIPSDYVIDALIPIGYSLEAPKKRKEPMRSLVCYNEYGSKVRK